MQLVAHAEPIWLLQSQTCALGIQNPFPPPPPKPDSPNHKLRRMGFSPSAPTFFPQTNLAYPHPNRIIIEHHRIQPTWTARQLIPPTADPAGAGCLRPKNQESRFYSRDDAGVGQRWFAYSNGLRPVHRKMADA